MEVIMCASQVKTIRSHRKCWAHNPALNSSHFPPLLSSPLHIPVRNLEKVTLCLEQPSQEHDLPGAILGLLRIFSCPSAQGRRVKLGTGARQTSRYPGRLLAFRGTPLRVSTLDNCLCYTPWSPISHLVNMLTTSPGGPVGPGIYLPISSRGPWNRPHWSFFWWYLIWTVFHWLNSAPSFNKRLRSSLCPTASVHEAFHKCLQCRWPAAHTTQGWPDACHRWCAGQWGHESCTSFHFGQAETMPYPIFTGRKMDKRTLSV